MHLDRTKFNILLSHRPELIDAYAKMDAYAKYGYDLVFTGHAHGGQFRISFIGGFFAPDQGYYPKYISGIYLSGNTLEIVNRGLGNSIILPRIFNNPEIITCKLRHMQ